MSKELLSIKNTPGREDHIWKRPRIRKYSTGYVSNLKKCSFCQENSNLQWGRSKDKVGNLGPDRPWDFCLREKENHCKTSCMWVMWLDLCSPVTLAEVWKLNCGWCGCARKEHDPVLEETPVWELLRNSIWNAVAAAGITGRPGEVARSGRKPCGGKEVPTYKGKCKISSG